jgi:hypothetical protein
MMKRILFLITHITLITGMSNAQKFTILLKKKQWQDAYSIIYWDKRLYPSLEDLEELQEGMNIMKQLEKKGLIGSVPPLTRESQLIILCRIVIRRVKEEYCLKYGVEVTSEKD